MNETPLEKLYATERWVGSGMGSYKQHYPHPTELIEPFLTRIDEAAKEHSEEYTLSVKTLKPMSVQDKDTELVRTAQGRFGVTVDFSKLNDANHRLSIGLVAALDLRRPLIQVFRGYNSAVCLNLAIFSADEIYKGYLFEGGLEMATRTLTRYVNTFKEGEEELMDNINFLSHVYWDATHLDQRVGSLYRHFMQHGNVLTAFAYAIRQMEDPNSRYALDDKGGTNAWNFTSAMTQYVTDKVPVDQKAEKTWEIIDHVASDLLDWRDNQPDDMLVHLPQNILP